MKRNLSLFAATTLFIALLGLSCAYLATPRVASAQDNPFTRARTPHCTSGTASGTYAYRMAGQIVGVGPVLINGIFTHNPDGTKSGNVYLSIAGQTIPNAGWSDGRWIANSDCTGSGEFFVAALNQTITYNFIATDGGKQIEVFNTNAGNAFHGVGRRIAEAGRAPSCNNATVLGSYGYRLEGSLPGVPVFVGSGVVTHTQDESFNGITTGKDTNSFNGQFVPRTLEGTYQLSSDCTGTGRYTDSLGNTINYVFVTVDGGREIYFQGTDPGTTVSGVGRRL